MVACNEVSIRPCVYQFRHGERLFCYHANLKASPRPLLNFDACLLVAGIPAISQASVKRLDSNLARFLSRRLISAGPGNQLPGVT